MARHGLTDNADSVKGIVDLRAQFHDLFNAKKIDELVNLFYAEDPALVPPDHDVIHGRAGAKEYFQNAANLGDVAFIIDVIECHADDTTGYVIGNYIWYDRTGDQEVTTEGRTFEGYRKDPDGTWRCTVDMWHPLDEAVIDNPLQR